MQFASVRCLSAEIEAEHLSRDLVATRDPAPSTRGPSPRRRRKLTVAAVEQALSEAEGNKVKAAKELGVGRATLYRFLSDHPVS